MDILCGVLAGHRLNSVITGVQVWVGGVHRQIWGYRALTMEAGAPKVMLLSENSTPQGGKLHPDAERNFQAAAERLVQGGVEFYTVYGPTWAFRAMRWTREYR